MNIYIIYINIYYICVCKISKISIFHSIYRLTFSHVPEINPLIISLNSGSCSIIEVYRFSCHIITTVIYFWLNLYSKKQPVMTDNTLMQAATTINVYASRDINSIILQHLYLTQQICTNMHLRKRVDSIQLPSLKTDPAI